MPNATERKALIICAFFSGLLCAIPMVGKVPIEGSSPGAVLKSLGVLLRSLAHPTVLGVWTLGALLMAMHVVMSRREAKAQEQALPASATELPAAADASSALPETPAGGA